MALQVWLPLTDNTRNYGLSNGVAVTNNGATLDNNGRIGKCYSFNGTNNKLTCTLSSTISKSIGSIALWVKFNSFPGSSSFYEMIHIGSNGGYANCLFGFYMEYTNRINISINGSSTNTNSYTHSLSANTWYHLCATFDGTIVKLYINGAQVLSKEATKASYATAASNVYIGGTTSYWLNGKINDVRVYDNCLSPEDVKRLYQTKIWDIMPYTHMGREFLFDRSGYGLMPLVNTGTTWHGNALYFDGSSRMRPKAGNVGFNLTGGTMSVWFTPEVVPNGNNIIFVDSESKFGLGFLGSTSLLCASSSGSFRAIINGTFTAKKLENIMVVYDSSYSNIRIFRNGVEVSTDGRTNVWVEQNGLTVGGRTYSSGVWFKGKIHKIDIFKNQLTAAECIELYNKERTNFLPDEYVQLEYIQSTGTQYINTGINPCMNKIRCVCDVAPLNGNDTAFFGSRGTYYLFYCLSSNYFWPTSKCETIEGTLQVGEKYHVDWNKGALKVTGPNGVKQIGVRSNNTQDTKPMYIFNFNPTDSRAAVAKLYNFDIYIDDCIVRNFIPVKRKSDNAIGLYDMVSKNFFTNAGTGTFTAGPEW